MFLFLPKLIFLDAAMELVDTQQTDSQAAPPHGCLPQQLTCKSWVSAQSRSRGPPKEWADGEAKSFSEDLKKSPPC